MKTLCVSGVWHLQPSVSKLKGRLFRVAGMSLPGSSRSSVLRSWQGLGAEVAVPKGTSVRGGGCQGAGEVCCGLFRALNEEREPSSAACLVRGSAGSHSPETSAGYLVTHRCITQLSLKGKHHIISAHVWVLGEETSPACREEGGQQHGKQEGGWHGKGAGCWRSPTSLSGPASQAPRRGGGILEVKCTKFPG